MATKVIMTPDNQKGLSDFQFRPWMNKGFTLNQALEWLKYGFDLKQAEYFREKGYDALSAKIMIMEDLRQNSLLNEY